MSFIGNLIGKVSNIQGSLIKGLVKFSPLGSLINAFKGQQKQNDVSRMLHGVLGNVQNGNGIQGPKVAANETGRIAGKTTIIGGDRDAFGFKGVAGKSYNMLNDTGLSLNAKYDNVGRGQTAVSKTGLTLSGSGGTSHIEVSAKPSPQVKINGQILRPGQSRRTADGGLAALSQDGRELTVKTREGYEIKQNILKDSRPLDGKYDPRISITVKTPQQGVARDCRMPGGVLGETFDFGKGRQHGTEQAKGNYEVPAGIFGTPKSSMHAADLKPVFDLLKHCGLENASPRFPENNPVTGTPINWAQEAGKSTIEKMMQQMTLESNKNAKKAEESSGDEKTDQLSKLLQIALASGNINLAMMIFGQLETKSANDLTKTLIQKVQKMQEEKRAITKEIGGLGSDAEGMKKMQELQGKASEKGDDINMLNGFIKDVAQNKQTVQELVSSFTKSEHDTTKSLLSKFS